MANEIGQSEAAAVIQELWRRTVMSAKYSSSIHMQVAFTDMQDVSKKNDIAHLPIFPRISVNTVSSAGAVTNQAVTLTDQTITIDQWKEATVELVDRAGWQSTFGDSKSLARRFAEEFGPALGENIDSNILALHGSITTNTVGSTSSPGPMSLPLARAALQKLDEQRVQKKDRNFVLAPKGFWEVFGNDAIALAQNIGGSKSVIVDGPTVAPRLYGARWYETQEVATSGSVDKNLLLHRQTIGLIIQRNFEIVQFAKIALTTRINGNVLFGRAVIREEHGCVINTAT